jgi:hypothetical protein
LNLIDEDFVETCMSKVEAKTEYGIIHKGTRVIDANGNVLDKSFRQTGRLSTVEFILSWFKWKTAFYFFTV